MDCPTVECPSCSKQVRVCELPNYNGRCEDCWIGGYMSMSEYSTPDKVKGLNPQQEEEIESLLRLSISKLRKKKCHTSKYDLTRLPQKYKHSLKDAHEPVEETPVEIADYRTETTKWGANNE